MVKSSLIAMILGCLLLPFSLFPENVQVTAEVNSYTVQGDPISVSVMITHKSSLKVDKKSFKLGKEPQEVEFIKNVLISPQTDLIISIYHFTLAPKKPGVYVLAPISVKVNGREYTTLKSAYSVN